MRPRPHSNARILIIDDQPERLALLLKVLSKAGYLYLQGVSDSSVAISSFLEFGPDLVIQDLHLNHVDGFGLLSHIQSLVDADDYLPVLILTEDMSRQSREKALAFGANDFVSKPFTITEVTLRVANLLHARYLHQELARKNRDLDRIVRRRTDELEFAQKELLERLAKAAEFRDDDTAEHTRRVSAIVNAVALQLGLSPDDADLMANASLLHDLGKIGIQDEILRKPDKLTAQEYEEIKKHTLIGANILAGSRSRVLQMAETIALYHHECWDGSGYMGLKGEDIPLAGRIVAVADVFDALTNRRPYKKAWTIEEAVIEIRKCAGTQLDPTVVEAFTAVVASEWVDEAIAA